MPLHLTHSGLTDTGRVRAGNEDAWAADAEQMLYIVADGMGGHAAGEIAANLVVESLPKMVERRMGRGKGQDTANGLLRRLRAAVSRLSRDVYDHAASNPNLTGMGATVVAVMVRDDHAYVVHLGDSRAYLLRANTLKLLTKDHSVVQELIDAGYITEEEAATHPARNRITASVGMPGGQSPDSRRIHLKPGDKLILCTDGLAGMIPDEQIAAIADHHKTPDQACRALIDAANHAGGHDNITVVVVEAQ